MVSGIEEFSKHLASEYLIDKIDFQDEDIFIDCGANVGELIHTLQELSKPSLLCIRTRY